MRIIARAWHPQGGAFLSFSRTCPYQKPYPRLVERRGQLDVAHLKAEGFYEQAERTTAKMGLV